MNKNYSVNIKILSPTHIGAGVEKNWQRGADFVHAHSNIYILDQRKVWLDLDDKQQSCYLNFMGSGKLTEIERMLIDELDLKEVASHIFEYGGKFREKEIKTLIRDGNDDAYIPGSSIKGAMSSAIFHLLYEGVNKPQHYSEHTSKELLGTFDRALGRYLRPYDSTPLPTEINDIDLYNLYGRGINWSGDFKQNFRIVAETFKPDTEGVFRLSLADDLAAFVKAQRGDTALPTYYHNVFGHNPLETLFKIINNYTRTHIQRELAYFKTYNDHDDIELVIEQLDDLLKDIDKIGTSSCILRLAYGNGFHGITGDYRFKDHTSTITQPDTKNMIYDRNTRQKEPARYKSRRLVFPYNGLMGFVGLNINPQPNQP